MNRGELLVRLASWVVEHGFAHHSLAQLAKPLGTTRGVFSHYFNTHKGGIKYDIACQLLLHLREQRSRYLVYPVRACSGGIMARRKLFARQMIAYLQVSYEGVVAEQWTCPAFSFSREARFLTSGISFDSEYYTLLEELWRGPLEYKILGITGAHFEQMVSGPFACSEKAVLDFFRVG